MRLVGWVYRILIAYVCVCCIMVVPHPSKLKVPVRFWSHAPIKKENNMEHQMIYRSNMTVELIDSMGGDHSVVRSARVSSGSVADDASRDEGLINYLMRDRHGSPFEHNAFTFYIEAPIFVFREFMRHRIASYNEESGRYKQLEPVFYVPDETRKVVQEGKPGAYVFKEGNASQKKLASSTILTNSHEAYYKYLTLLNSNVAREVARMVLPVNIYSSMYVTMNARSLMNFLSLRSEEQGTYPSFPQWEIAEVARQMEEIFAEKMPVTYASFVKNGRVAP
jgi:thymidylate synthase (FAD)